MMERRIINSIKELKGLSKIEVDEYLIGNVVTLKEEDFNYLRDRGIILPSIFEEQYKALDDESKAYVEDLLVYYYKKIYTYVKSHESNIEYIYYDMYSFHNRKSLKINSEAEGKRPALRIDCARRFRVNARIVRQNEKVVHEKADVQSLDALQPFRRQGI